MKKLLVLFAFAFINSFFTASIFAQQGSMILTQAIANTGWSARYGHTSVVFNNTMWVIGGYANGSSNDVWYSTDDMNLIQTVIIK